MPDDELFRRYLEIGASMLGMTREQAERMVGDLVASSEVARSQATKAADWLVERGRAGTEELNELLRREVRQQVAALGLASRDEIVRLQAQIDELKAEAAAKAAAAPKAARKRPAPTKAAPKKAAPKTASATKQARNTAPAGISRSASAGPGVAGSSPAAGDAVPPKG